MTEPAPWLAALLLKPALVVAAGAAIAAMLRRRSAPARHAVWAGAILALLALPALALVLPPLRVPIPATGADPSVTIRTGVGVAPGADRRRVERGAPDPEAMWSGDGEAGLSSGASVAILAVWLAGVILLGGRRIHSALQLRRLLRRARPLSSPRLASRISAECGALGLRRRPDLLSSDEIAVPGAAGLIRPVVLLPAAAVQWDDADQGAALIHELGHIRRRDCFLNLLADAAAIVYWCNPLVWLAVRRLRSESERACDDLVLARGTAPEGYARLLLAVARTASRFRALPAAATAMARADRLESRLLAVLDDRVARRSPPRGVAALLTGLGLVAALPAAAITFGPGPAAAAPALPEPDRLADSLAPPESERLLPRTSGFAVPPAAQAALRGPDSALTARLIRALDRVPRGPEDLVRERAAWALTRARDGRLVEPLLEALAAPDWRVRSYAAWSLATARDPRAVPPLIDLLDHPVWRLRAMAAYALREAADRRALRPMAAALEDPAWQVRLEAVGYFIGLGGPEAAERVHSRRNDRHVAVRRAAQAALSSP